MESLQRNGMAAGVAGRLVITSLLAVASTGIAVAQTGTITFQGAIVNPSCGFRPAAGQLHASCVEPSGRTVSAPFPMPPALMPGHARIGSAQLHVEPVPDRSLGGAREMPGAYVMVATYH
ncbi:hypothetical protein PO002_17855 [Cupriavidus necator]|uniref:hypothetical protein n=1 Tax=Cupriavidus necator TaxID=106590 RepID=UPI0039C18AF6